MDFQFQESLQQEFSLQQANFAHENAMPPDNDIEDAIRRQMQAERLQAPPAQAPQPPPSADPPPYYAAPKPRKRAGGGLAGAGAALLALLGKLKFLLVGLKLLTFAKLLLTAGSMLVSMWIWAKFYGWPFGIGVVLLIFIHECGHAWAARLRGRGTGIMVFIPLMGAFVTTKRYGRNLTEDAFIGIMGPVVGTLASIACVGIYSMTHAPIWLVLGWWGFFVNLFNLAPTAPLDGGWITPLFSPKLLLIGAVLLLFLVRYNWLIAVLALMSLPRILSAWKADPKTQPYYQATSSDRWKFALAYLGLAAFLAVAQYSLHLYLQTHLVPVA